MTDQHPERREPATRREMPAYARLGHEFSSSRLVGPMGSGLVVEEPAIDGTDAVLEVDRGRPAHAAQLVGAHQLARRAVRLGQVVPIAPS